MTKRLTVGELEQIERLDIVVGKSMSKCPSLSMHHRRLLLDELKEVTRERDELRKELAKK